MSENTRSARFISAEIAKLLPEHSDSMLADEYLTGRPEASCRVFRAYPGMKNPRNCVDFKGVVSLHAMR